MRLDGSVSVWVGERVGVVRLALVAQCGNAL